MIVSGATKHYCFTHKEKEDGMARPKESVLIAAVIACFVLCVTTAQAAPLAIADVAVASYAMDTTPTDGGDDDGDESPCAAAAALGADDGQLETLRALRDNVLAKSPAGRQIIKIYYANSNAVIAAFDKSPALKSAAKSALETIIPLAEIIAGK